MKFLFKFLIISLGVNTINPASLIGLNSNSSKPNVLLIYTDDHRYTGVHALGSQQVQTPAIDKLSEEGITFTNAYLMGSFSGATCIPSRAMLHSGRHLFQLKGQGHTIPAEHKTIGETFQEAGYHAHIVGKWHQDRASLARSFQSGSTLMGLGVYLTDHYRMPFWDWDDNGEFKKEDAYLLQYDTDGKVQRRPLNKDDKTGPTGTEKDGPHTSEVFADNAIKFIENYHGENPFFMYLAFHAPHDPRQATKEFRDLYPPESIALTPSYMPEHPFDNGHIVLRDEELAPWPRTPEIARQQLADYYAIISHLDAQIGRVIASLKASGKYENTIIVLAGDSGLGVGNHGLLGKQNVYDEDGVHIPFIISGNYVKNKGKKINAFSYIHDIFPTVCALAEIDAPASISGKSLIPVINDEVAQVRDYTYHAYRQHQRAYRKGAYKLIEYVKAPDFSNKNGEFISGSRVTQLFNITNDPWETFNLAYFPEHKMLLKSMQEEMRETALELEDTKESVDYKYDFWDYY